jgi:23S rRNA pseudouridine1911/1915/1917 synthase
MMIQYNVPEPVRAMPAAEPLCCRIPAAYAGRRLDQTLAELLPDYSRRRLQQWIKAGQVEIDGRVVRPREPVAGGEWVTVVLPQEPETVEQAQAIPLAVRYEDEDLLVIDKPAGLVAHPAAGNPDGTLVNALLHYAPELAALPRAGLVHRLDKDTSGLLVVARSLRAHTSLVAQLQARTLEREYQAVVTGVMPAGGRIEAPIGRHPIDRKRMAVVANGRPAVTHYRVLRRFHAHTHLWLKLETGRTHQIRVHLAHLRYPVVGDPVYGGRRHLPAGLSERCRTILQAFPRQALHAARLALTHPGSSERLQWQAELPADLVELLTALAEDDARSD